MKYKIIERDGHIFPLLYPNHIEDPFKFIGLTILHSEGTCAITANDDGTNRVTCLGSNTALQDSLFIKDVLFSGKATNPVATARFLASSRKIYAIGTKDSSMVFGPVPDFNKCLAETGDKGLYIFRFSPGLKEKRIRKWEMGQWRKISKKQT